MPRPHPPESRQRAVEFARMGDKPIAEIAGDLGISDSCLRGWLKQADIDEGRRGGTSSVPHDAATPTAKCSAPSTTKPPTPPTRHNQPHTPTVRQTGGASNSPKKRQRKVHRMGLPSLTSGLLPSMTSGPPFGPAGTAIPEVSDLPELTGEEWDGDGGRS